MGDRADKEKSTGAFLVSWVSGDSGTPVEQATGAFLASRESEGSATDPAVLLENYRRIDRGFLKTPWSPV